jgi:hypothetical protein
MPGVTWQSLTEAHPPLAPVAEAAARQGLRLVRLLGAGGYGAVFEATAPGWGECVLKVAGVEFAGACDVQDGEMGPYRDVLPHSLYGIRGPSLTGPLLPAAPASLEEASSLLQEACRRQQEAGADCPLARLLALWHLGGRPAALFERLRGRSLRYLLTHAPAAARAAAPAVVHALTALHDTFGGHGDLKPEHVFVDNGRVVFIDPLPEGVRWVGSLGYALPVLGGGADDGPRKDLGSLAAILAELWGGTVGWDQQVVYCLANFGNGRFRCAGFEPAHVLRRMREGTAAVPAPVQAWILGVGQDLLDDWADAGARCDPGWSRSRLEALTSLFREQFG